MIRSMTGFGKSECNLKDKAISIAVRSVNSKQFDVVMHLPQTYRSLEGFFRSEAAKIVARGKFDVTMTCTMLPGAAAANINGDVVLAYFEQLKPVAEKMNIDPCQSNFMNSILRLPGVLNVEENGDNEEDIKLICECYQRALKEFNEYREKEGAALLVDILKRVGIIENLLSQVEPFEKNRIEQVRIRIEGALQDFATNAQIDKNRFEQELIYYLEKLDITEEKVRLKQHCNYFRQTIDGDENPGRKIGFICQEMGREINTLGSKANEANIQKIVVQMKDELEKIKEQILNVL